MKTEQPPPEPESDWQKTPFANLIRYGPSQTYFARIRVKGKLIRRSLKTKTLTVAKLRLADFEKNQRRKTRSAAAVHLGKMKFGDALNVYWERLQNNPVVKPATKIYYQYRIKALLKSWPDLKFRDVTQITPAECADWSDKNARVTSSSSHNHTVNVLRHVFQIAVENGARYDNPAEAAKRIPERTRKRIELPASAEFQKLVAEIRSSGSGFARPAADLVEFLAYGGFRKNEAAHITWADCDFDRGKIVLKGDPATGLKGRHAGESREIPMIPDMCTLLERIKAKRPNETPASKIMRVAECQKSIDRAVKILGIRRITHHDLRHLFAIRHTLKT